MLCELLFGLKKQNPMLSFKKDESEFTDMGGTGSIAVAFRNLIIDEKKAKGALMFRLKESVSAIIVHKSIKETIENSLVTGLSFVHPAEYSA